jgi:hypothetical protein
VGSTTYHFFNEGYGGCGSDPYCFVYSVDSSRPYMEGPIQMALYYMADHGLIPTDRKLYIGAGTYTENVYVDATWPSVSGLLAIVGTGDTPDQVVINGSIYVKRFPTGFTIQNLTVNNITDPD